MTLSPTQLPSWAPEYLVAALPYTTRAGKRRYERTGMLMQYTEETAAMTERGIAALPKIYFFCNRPGRPDDTHDYHPGICIAEGLRDLGIQSWSNIDHWYDRKAGAYLLRHDPALDPAACDVIVLSEDWFERKLPLPESVQTRDGPITVYLDKQDGTNIFSLARSFPFFDLILRASYQRNTQYPSNFRPWAFGIAQRYIDATDQITSPTVRSHTMLVSHRNTRYPHTVRAFADRKIVPRLMDKIAVKRFVQPFDSAPSEPDAAALWHLTGRRYSPEYYKALSLSTASYAFGGYFVAPWLKKQNSVTTRLAKRIIAKLQVATYQLNQWDSYRIWESFAAGCAVVHLDLEKYGCVLPEMPERWVHYAAIDLDNLETSIAPFRERHTIEEIGRRGREWALRFYGPRAVAKRFLTEIASIRAKTRF